MSATPNNTRGSPPAFLSVGFRPFFFLGALFAAILIALWVPWFLGLIAVPSAFPPVAWHIHELLFGFVPAIVAGFLLTAVANWTARPPVAGWPLAALVAIWCAGRVAIAVSTHLDPAWTAAVAVAFPIVLAAVVGREIALARNRRNLKIVVVLIGLAAADALFHYEIWQFGRPRQAHLAAVALVLLLVLIVSGRIIPTFTANWMKAHRPGAPLPPAFNRMDLAVLLLSGAALMGWATLTLFDAGPWHRAAVGWAMIGAGVANFLRQARWQPRRTFAEPLLAILHIAYLFVGLGFLLGGAAVAWDDYDFATAGLHAWTTGALGTMMLGVMTRVSRGHTGRPLTAPGGTVALYVLILIAAIARIAAGLHPQATSILVPISGLSWIAAFGGFLILYGRMLVSPRV